MVFNACNIESHDTMKLLLSAAVLGLLAGAALAQNNKGTGVETRTTTTTNPAGSIGPSTPSDGRSHATIPSGTSRANPEATAASQMDDHQKGGGISGKR
jgi:hypothetical protein